MTRRAPTYLRQPGDGEGLMPRQASIILHMGVVKAPLCNSGLSVSHLTEVFETLRKAVPVTFLFLSLSKTIIAETAQSLVRLRTVIGETRRSRTTPIKSDRVFLTIAPER